MFNKFIVLFFFLSQLAFAQVEDSLDVEMNEVIIDTVAVDSTALAVFKNEIINAKAIQKFYNKLQQLEKRSDCKLRIAHIGDSHIQADLFSGKMRTLLQKKYGNAGLGFSFPYNLAKTNGNYFIKYSSNINFESYRNIYPDSTKPVGLSGIALFTKEKDFVIQLQVRDTSYAFTSLKLVTPNKSGFDLATASKEIIIESNEPKIRIHKIKSGEALSIIANKYNVTVNAIKKANGLRSNAIRAGKTLKIPTNETVPKIISRKEFIPLTLFEDEVSQNYYSTTKLNNIYLVSNPKDSLYALNGVVLENSNSGIVYSAIGVNGAKASDFNKFPLFFNQLKVLESDLIVISLGTNESFDKRETSVFYEDLLLMIQNIRKNKPGVEILLTTPPPSLFKRKYPNTLVADYTKKIIEIAEENNVAVWNMFEALGGLFSVEENYKKGLMSRDKVHYSKAGYEKQGELFFEALELGYEQYKEAGK